MCYSHVHISLKMSLRLLEMVPLISDAFMLKIAAIKERGSYQPLANRFDP
jgi:hypothetical protein